MIKLFIKIFARFGALKGALIVLALALIALPALYCALLYTALYADLQPSKNSRNAAATSKFIDGYFFVRVADSLRWAFSYDSAVLRPLFAAAASRFEQGAALLPPDSVEDAMWWATYHKHIYGFTKSRSDKSLLKHLNDADYARVWGYIQRLPYGKIYNDAPLLRDWRLANMIGLVIIYTDATLKRKYDFAIQHAEQASEISAHLRAAFEKYYQNTPEQLHYFELYNSLQIRTLIAPILRYHAELGYAEYSGNPADIPLNSEVCKQMAGANIEQYFRAAINMSELKKIFFRKIYRQDSHYLNALFAYCPERRGERLEILDIISNKFENQYQKGELKWKPLQK